MLIYCSLLIVVSAVALGAIGAVGCELAADAAQAIRGSGRSQEWFALTIGATPQKLSLQLTGQKPFTLLCRFAHPDIYTSTTFWPLFLELQDRRLNRGVARIEARMDQLVDRCERLTDAVADLLSGGRAFNERRSA